MRNLAVVQRLYAMFPQGGPGTGLALLRASLALQAMLWEPPAWIGLPPGMALALQTLVVAGLAVGVFTTAFCLACALPGVLALLPPQAQAWPWAVLVLATSAALILLGPGAYSVDASLYGRRQLILPSGRRRRR